VYASSPITLGGLAKLLGRDADLIDNLGVDPGRIVVLPNDIEAPEEGLDSFKRLVLAAKKIGFHFCSVAIPQNPKFDVFNADERSVIEIAADEPTTTPRLRQPTAKNATGLRRRPSCTVVLALSRGS